MEPVTRTHVETQNMSVPPEIPCAPARPAPVTTRYPLE